MNELQEIKEQVIKLVEVQTQLRVEIAAHIAQSREQHKSVEEKIKGLDDKIYTMGQIITNHVQQEDSLLRNLTGKVMYVAIGAITGTVGGAIIKLFQ